MLAYIKGNIQLKKQNYVIVENQGVGYKVFVSNELMMKKNEGDQIELYLHHQIGEQVSALYGFDLFDHLELFQLLISISGVGPKTALGVFAVAEVSDIKSAILNEDASVLKKVSGIGAKTAERIVLELKNKVSGSLGEVKSKEEMGADVDAIEALTSLGFSPNDARDAMKQIDKTINDSGEKVRAALKLLNR